MRIAIASGKGGTGKTTIATNLALAVSRSGQEVQLLDCDVEEPNCHIFLRPTFESRQEVTVPVPRIDQSRCTGCGTCAEVCEFNALACLSRTVLVFDHLCHGCGGCQRFCPEGAIWEDSRPVGAVEEGEARGIRLVRGILNIGEAMSPPVIRAVKARARDDAIAIVDAPPGTSCPVIESVRGADLVLLVTEPTPFGLNDLELAVGMARALGLSFGVAINRCDAGDRRVHDYCAASGIELLMEISDDRSVAEAYSRGELMSETLPTYADAFRRLFETVRTRVGGGGMRR